MFPPSDPQCPSDTFQTGLARHSGGQWDPWSSPSTGLCPPKQPPPSSTMQRIRRSNSLTPPSNTSMMYPQDPWGSGNQNDNSSGRIKPRSLSLSSPGETAGGLSLSHCPLSPQNSLASSGSGSGSDSIYSDDSHRPSSFHIPGSGMRGLFLSIQVISSKKNPLNDSVLSFFFFGRRPVLAEGFAAAQVRPFILAAHLRRDVGVD